MFAALVVGTTLLMLPFSTPGADHRATVLQAAFTAVSALSVTGLVVVDTATYWTTAGQVVILLLIQVGGFGMMSLATFFGMAVARRAGLRSKVAVAEVIGSDYGAAASMLRSIVRITLTIEGTAWALLTTWFALAHHLPLGTAVWHGLFHAVSAFNNAGFALYSDNVMGFADDPVVLLVLSAEIVLGGLGFPVVLELLRHRQLPRRWTMNTRLVLLGTVLLLGLGTLHLLVLEWSNPGTLGPMGVGDKVLNAFFQATVSRTAGFNSIDIGQMHEASWLAMDVMMFVGVGPAGTGGGIKITTALVLVFLVLSELRGDPYVLIFGKRLARSVHRQAITVAVSFFVLVMVGTSVILAIEPYSLSQVLLEVVSAMSTTGLSTGITPNLTAPSQVVLIVLMFVGRIGPATMGAALVLRRRPLLFEPPKERPLIG